MGDSHALQFARRVASGEATKLGSSQVEPEHLLLGLCKLEDPQAQTALVQFTRSAEGLAEAQREIASLLKIFARLGLSPAQLRYELRKRIGGERVEREVGSAPRVPFTPGAQALLDEAERIARAARAASTNTAHLLAAIGSSPGPTVQLLFNEANVSAGEVHRLAGAKRQQDRSERNGAITHSVPASAPPFSASERETTGVAAKRTMERLQSFYRISQAVAAAALSDELFTVIAREVRSVLPRATRGAILTLTSAGELKQRANWPNGVPSGSRKWGERAIRERAAFIWSAKAPGQERPPTSVMNAALRSALYAPMICADEVLGVLYVDNQEHADAFTPADLDMVRAIADQAAIAVFNQRLRREQERLAVVRVNLGRHFRPTVVERLIAHLSAPGAGPEWANRGAVVAVQMYPPLGLSPGERMLRQNELSLSLANGLLARGAAISWGAGVGLMAVFDKDDEGRTLALKTGWDLARMSLLGGWTLGVGLEHGDLTQQLVAPEPTQPDLFSPYESGLRAVCAHTPHGHPGLEELLTFQQRLKENIRYARMFSDPEARRAERNEILNGLNGWSLRHLGVSFNALCSVPDAAEVALVAPEYHVVGVAVEAAQTLARAAAPGWLLLGPDIYARLPGECVATRLPDLEAYRISALC